MTQNNEVINAILERRSIRKYTDEEISRDDITAILEAGRWAPSGLNNQPCRYLVLKAGDERQEPLAETTKYGHIVRAAKALIVVLLDKKTMYSPVKDHQGAGAAIQNMLLAIHSLDLGGVWLGEIVNHEAEALPVLGLSPDEYELMAVIALGKPDQKGSSTRKELSELMLEEY